jgi:hypothetical protein
MMPTFVHLLVLSAPGRDPEVFAGTKEEIHRAIEGLRDSWNPARTAVDRRRRALVGVDGRAAHLVRARSASSLSVLALIAWRQGDPVAVYFVADVPSGRRLADELGTSETSLVPLREISALPVTRHAPSVLLEFARAGALPDTGMPRGETWCPRCSEQRLHRDPVFDSHSHRDGARICNACGLLEALAEEQACRDQPAR